MRIKALACIVILVVSKLISAEETTQPSVNVTSDSSTAENFKLQNARRLTLKRYSEIRSKVFFNFDGISEREKNDFLNDFIDSNVTIDPYYNRFNRMINEPTFTEKELEKKELYIESLLNECVKLVGPEPDDNMEYLTLTRDIYIYYNFRIGNLEFLYAVQPNYMLNRMYKCTRYLYSEEYDINNFEYTKVTSSKKEVEKKYALIYLYVKEAGLLRKMPRAFYPKLLLREYADQTGLTEFIQVKEKAANKQLKHNELAITFFGSEEQWLKGFYKFLDEKIAKLPLNFVK